MRKKHIALVFLILGIAEIACSHQPKEKTLEEIITQLDQVRNNQLDTPLKGETINSFNFLTLQPEPIADRDKTFRIFRSSSGVTEVWFRSTTDSVEYDFSFSYLDSLASIALAVNVRPAQELAAELPILLLSDRCNHKLLCIDNSQTAVFLLNEKLIPTHKINYFEGITSVFQPSDSGLLERSYSTPDLSDRDLNNLTLKDNYKLFGSPGQTPVIRERSVKTVKPFLLLTNIENVE